MQDNQPKNTQAQLRLHPRPITVSSFILMVCFLGWFVTAPLPLSANSSSHFNNCSSNTGNNATIIIRSDVSINNGPELDIADEVAVFNTAGTLCVGVGVWDGNNLALTVWGDDSQTPSIDGLVAGHEMRFHIWDSSADLEYESVTATYSLGDGLYAINSIQRVSTFDLTTTPPTATPSATPTSTLHYNNCVSNTGNNATIILQSDVTITSGAALDIGDEIAIFNSAGTLCVGVAVWDGNNLALTVWGDDSQTPSIDGLVAGDTMRFYVWDSSASKEYDIVTPTYSLGDGLYGINSIQRIGALDLKCSEEIPTATPTATATATPTSTPTATATATPTSTPTATATASPTSTPTATATASPTSTPTASPTATATSTAIATATSTAIATATSTATATATATATSTATATASPTATSTATATATATAMASPTPSPSPTATPPMPAVLVMEHGSADNVDNTSWTTISLTEVYTSPIVVVSVGYGAGASPVVARVRNVSSSQFEVMVERMDALSTAVEPVTIGYLVVEEGVYNEANHGIKLEARQFTSTVTDGKNRWDGQARSYYHSYVQPVVVGQVMSANDPDASVFWAFGSKRTSPPTASTLRVGKHVGEDTDITRSDETIGYIVVEAGSGTLDGVLYEAGVGADTVRGYDNRPAYTYALPSIYRLTSAVVSSAGMDGVDGGWPTLYGGVAGASSLNLAIDEDQFVDSERRHVSEQVAYFAFGEPRPVGSNPSLVQGMVAGVDNSQWISVNLPNEYNSMVVVASTNYDENNVPLVARVRNATGNSFELTVARMDGSTDVISNPVDVYYMVVEEGVYNSAEHGITMEATKYLSTRTDQNNSWRGEWMSYQNSYSQPVVVGQVMSANDVAASQFWARGRAVRRAPDSSTLYVGKHVGEDPDPIRAAETIGYIVFESGLATVNGVELLAAVGSDTVRGIVNNPPYTYVVNDIPTISGAIVSSAAMDGSHGGWPVLYGDAPFSGGLQLAIDEDTLGDAERRHTTEQVAFVLFSSVMGDSAEYVPSPEEPEPTNLVAFTGQTAEIRRTANLMSSITIGSDTFLIGEDTTIEGDLQSDSSVYITAIRNESDELVATLIRVLADMSSSETTLGIVTAVSESAVEVDGQSFAINEQTDLEGSITVGSHVSVIDSLDDGVLSNRVIKRLDNSSIYSRVNSFSTSSITLGGSSFALDEGSYILGSVEVGELALVGLSEDRTTALLIDTSTSPSAVQLISQRVERSATLNATLIAIALLATIGGAALVDHKRKQ